VDGWAQLLADRLGDAIPQLANILEDAAGDATTRWPGLTVDRVRIADAIVERVEGESDPVAAIASLSVAELMLAQAALVGDSVAVAAIERIVRHEAIVAVARLGGDEASAADVAQELVVKLVLPHDGSGRLAAYTGHGSLRSWIRVASTRTAISLHRTARPSDGDDALFAIPDDAEDPSLAFLKASYRAEFKRVFAAALVALAPRERTLLRLQVIDQLTIENIGRFYQVSRATAARWLADARKRLVADTRHRLVDALGLDDAELTELMTLLTSNLYATLSQLLRDRVT
jgi:RNA polymerase sigma-70 factor (ECF subfamily)